MALVTIFSNFPCTRVDSRYIFETSVGQISIFDKVGN